MQGIYLVFTAPVQGMEDEYHRWYDSQHIPDILAIPGVEVARRYALRENSGTPAPAPFLALYGFSDITRAVSGIIARRGTERLRSSPTVDRRQSVACVFDLNLAVARQYTACAAFEFALARKPVKTLSAEVLTGMASAVQAGAETAPFAAVQFRRFPDRCAAEGQPDFDSAAEIYTATTIEEGATSRSKQAL